MTLKGTHLSTLKGIVEIYDDIMRDHTLAPNQKEEYDEALRLIEKKKKKLNKEKFR